MAYFVVLKILGPWTLGLLFYFGWLFFVFNFWAFGWVGSVFFVSNFGFLGGWVGSFFRFQFWVFGG